MNSFIRRIKFRTLRRLIRRALFPQPATFDWQF
jgi:hypothetical protein